MPDDLPVYVECWRELRDERGKLCARLEARRLLLEIRRSDRDLVAQFNLRDYINLIDMQTVLRED